MVGNLFFIFSDKGGGRSAASGWTEHTWSTFITRAEEETEQPPLGKKLLSDFQKDKFIHFFYHVLDLNRDHVISQVVQSMSPPSPSNPYNVRAGGLWRPERPCPSLHAVERQQPSLSHSQWSPQTVHWLFPPDGHQVCSKRWRVWLRWSFQWDHGGADWEGERQYRGVGRGVGGDCGKGAEACWPAHVAPILPQDSLRHHQQERLRRDH